MATGEGRTSHQIQKPETEAWRLPASDNKRRKLENGDKLRPNYYKICAIIRDLRPHFIEVLRTPDFRDGKAAHEIRKQMKLVMDLYKQMTSDTNPVGKSKKPKENNSLEACIRKDDQKTSLQRHQEEKGKEPHSVNNYENSVDGRIQGTYIIGGSSLGWNFIMYPSHKIVYYGVTKEAFRSTN